MCDVFERAARSNELDRERARLFELIRQTPHLDWLLATKRTENILEMLPADWNDGYPNVWLIASVENQAMANQRIPELLRVTARVYGLSCEPLLGEIDFLDVPVPVFSYEVDNHNYDGDGDAPIVRVHGIDWVIVGGESGPNWREMKLDWARSLRDQCEAASVPFFYKQDNGRHPGTLPELDGVEWHQFPEVRG